MRRRTAAAALFAICAGSLPAQAQTEQFTWADSSLDKQAIKAVLERVVAASREEKPFESIKGDLDLRRQVWHTSITIPGAAVCRIVAPPQDGREAFRTYSCFANFESLDLQMQAYEQIVALLKDFTKQDPELSDSQTIGNTSYDGVSFSGREERRELFELLKNGIVTRDDIMKSSPLDPRLFHDRNKDVPAMSVTRRTPRGTRAYVTLYDNISVEISIHEIPPEHHPQPQIASQNRAPPRDTTRPLPPDVVVGTTNGPPELTIENATPYLLAVTFAGPVTRIIEVEAGRSQTVVLVEGTFDVSATVTPPNVTASAGVRNYQRDTRYKVTYYIK
jgi:hypothetical protein